MSKYNLACVYPFHIKAIWPLSQRFQQSHPCRLLLWSWSFMVGLRQGILGVSIRCANFSAVEFPSDLGMCTSKTYCLLLKVNSPLPCLQKQYLTQSTIGAAQVLVLVFFVQWMNGQFYKALLMSNMPQAHLLQKNGFGDRYPTLTMGWSKRACHLRCFIWCKFILNCDNNNSALAWIQTKSIELFTRQGYSALWQMTSNPGLFRCAVAKCQCIWWEFTRCQVLAWSFLYRCIHDEECCNRGIADCLVCYPTYSYLGHNSQQPHNVRRRVVT